MSKLERWLPFKFRRNKSEKSQASPQGEQAAAQAVPVRQQDYPMAGPAQLPALMGRMLDSFYNDPFFRSDPFFREPLARFAELDRWFGDFSPGRFSPTLDVVDEETALRISAELPGMSKDDVQLSIDDDMLVLHGEKRNVDERTENGVYRSERYYGSFQRAVPLPGDIDRERAEASFRDGVLTVRFPKLAEAKEPSQRQIPIST